MTDLGKLLYHGWPGASWSLDGDSYDGLIWPTDPAVLAKQGPKPTLAAIMAVVIPPPLPPPKPLDDTATVADLLARLRSLGIGV